MKRISNKSLLALGMLLTLALAPVVSAQTQSFYVNADLGGSVTMDADLNNFFGPVAPGSKVKFDPGLRYGVSAGYQFTDWFALEAEVGSMSGAIDQITDATHVDAWFASVPFLVNAKFQYKNSSRFTPYIGIGVGGSAEVLDMDYVELNGIGVSGTDSTVVFAVQGVAGLRYNLNDQMSLGIEYRFLWADSPSWEADYSFGTSSSHISFGQIESQSLSLAFNFRF
jgi:opacity protein-like surface antigen